MGVLTLLLLLGASYVMSGKARLQQLLITGFPYSND